MLIKRSAKDSHQINQQDLEKPILDLINAPRQGSDDSIKLMLLVMISIIIASYNIYWTDG